VAQQAEERDLQEPSPTLWSLAWTRIVELAPARIYRPHLSCNLGRRQSNQRPPPGIRTIVLRREGERRRRLVGEVVGPRRRLRRGPRRAGRRASSRRCPAPAPPRSHAAIITRHSRRSRIATVIISRRSEVEA
jgi:hypothetical protein